MRPLPLVLSLLLLAALPARADDAAPTLTLEDAIRLALSRNKELKVTSFDRGITRANLLAARGAFDPAFTANGSKSQTREEASLGQLQLDTLKTDQLSVGVTGMLPIGTTYTLTGSTQDVRDFLSGYGRNYQTFGGFTVTQPLLKGFGFAANLENIRVAKANRSISDLQYRQSAILTVTSVVVSYSNLLLAHDQLEAARRSRSLAAELLTGNEKEYKVGNISKSDVTTARFFVASQEESIVVAERSVRDNQNQLRELIGDEVFLEQEPLFVLAPAPVFDVHVDLKADLERALATRPDYAQARLAIQKGRAVEAAALNGLLPQVDFVGGYGYNGLGYTFPASRQMVQDHQNPSYSAGLAVTIPLTFSTGRGTLRAARLTRQQSEEDLRRLESDIAVGLANAAGQIETTRRRVAADQAAYALAREALDAEEKKKRAGTSTTLAVVQQQQFVTEAEVNLSLALAAQRQAVAAYDQALGTTLERYRVKLADE